MQSYAKKALLAEKREVHKREVHRREVKFGSKEA
jgi:hypothetical protein